MISFKGSQFPKDVILHAMYLYRAVDKYGNTLDFMLSERRNTSAATLAGIEVANMIRKRQFENSGRSGFRQFAG